MSGSIEDETDRDWLMKNLEELADAAGPRFDPAYLAIELAAVLRGLQRVIRAACVVQTAGAA